MTARPVYVTAAAAVSPFGLDTAALLEGLRGRRAAARSSLLATSHPALAAVGVEDVPVALDPVPAKARKTMSRSAYLGAVALRALTRAAGWGERDGVGYFLGVGASGGAMAELQPILAAAFLRGGAEQASESDMLDPWILSPGFVAACNPLLAFQLMNNFTMCHGAILEGTTGPSGAFFSRGAGTVAALVEAREAVAGGECERAIAGGADSALHPVTWLEHERLGDTAARLPPGEGAGLLALSAVAPEGGPVIVVEAAVQVTRADDPAARAAAVLAALGGGCDVVIVGADDAGQRDLLVQAARCPSTPVGRSAGPEGRRRWAHGERGEASASAEAEAEVVGLDGVGTCLAATPALGWAAAIDALRAGATRAAVVTLDGAGDLAVAVFARRGGGAA